MGQVEVEVEAGLRLLGVAFWVVAGLHLEPEELLFVPEALVVAQPVLWAEPQPQQPRRPQLQH